MEIREAIYKRRSVRNFKDTEVDEAIIKSLLEDAMAAPSACNKQPWEFYVIQNKEIQNELKKKIMFCNYNSPLMIVVCGNTKKALTKKENDYWTQDASAAIENILLSALSFGLGTCWCGVGFWIFKFIAPELAKYLEIDENHVVAHTMIFGYPDVEYVRKREPKDFDSLLLLGK